MDNWIMIREYPTTIEGLTIRGYKCKHCDRPVLASIPDEDKWDTNILTYIYCPHCGQKLMHKGENMKNLTDDNFLKDQTKEQLIIFLHNTELELESLRKRMEKLTGCREFGTADGMNGNCIECFYNDKRLFEKCEKFKFSKE